ncbi:DUF2309 domain-containing protein [Sphingomonas rosea]|uniref:Probable inorganic carbon transporter subunit DabA n=1 Tax=Sphingomonas rosea TaxID=335605 RepID=A0ABP7U9G3_9SPHN
MTQLSPATILAAADAAIRAIPPLWPLATSVAVNPFLGQAHESLPLAAARWGKASGVAVTMPRAWFAERIASGAIEEADLVAALEAAPVAGRPTLAAVKTALKTPRAAPQAVPTVADLAAGASGIDWPALVAARFSHWAATYFDAGQALWPTTPAKGAFAAWRLYASHDLTPEIAGLRGFAALVADLPEERAEAMAFAATRLGLSETALPAYFHRLLVGTAGWGQVARYRLWQAELGGKSDRTGTDLVAILLAFELALAGQYGAEIESLWAATVKACAEPLRPSADDIVDSILQEAAERAAQRRLAAVFAAPARAASAGRPTLQAAFCIDVRSEVFRRALEGCDPGIRTLGFAGFFGIATGHRPLGSDVTEHRLPVLLTPAVQSEAGHGSPADRMRRIASRARRAWGRFRLAAVSSFAFVEAAGPLYAAKLVRDGLGIGRRTTPNDPVPRFTPDLSPEDRTGMAAIILGAMGLTRDFAPLVLLAGHGANVVNNPHASALHCGACGGASGEVNARLLAGLLNDPAVRIGLAARGIAVPDDTLFLGALHDTTTDAVTLYTDDHVSPAHAEAIAQARRWLASAGMVAATERAARLPRAVTALDVAARARNWAELRPEWALAGCQAFVAAPRDRTRGKDLAGRAFLHDYDWRADEGFATLELILTAPVVVASWISLQYYGSSVAPDLFGAGNKLLHNVTGGIGVVEGNGGLLRSGLPLQSVTDGERLIHEPLRLSVLVEAPREAIANILARHPGVAALFDNKWLHLIALDDRGQLAWRYVGEGQWKAVEGAVIPKDDLVAA